MIHFVTLCFHRGKSFLLASPSFVRCSDYIFTFIKIYKSIGRWYRVIGFRPHLLVVEPSAVRLSDSCGLDADCHIYICRLRVPSNSPNFRWPTNKLSLA
nr:MAG TPA: hypothetical protein [Caudoviricetes sp.]